MVRQRTKENSTDRGDLMEQVRIIECPRDAWQGLPQVIPTAVKVEYLRRLIELGFRHIDAVSFVSSKHVPQMADSEQVVKALRPLLSAGPDGPEIIGIVLNEKGLARALATPGVTTIGYPYSISDHFQRANTNMSPSDSRALVEKLKVEAQASGRNLVVYISMAFGNPYGEPWGREIVKETIEWLKGIGVRTVSLADTVGTATAGEVGTLFRAVKECAVGIELGVHLHSRPEGAAEKVLAAYEAGCRRFDSALTGLGGCPFAGDELVGNMPTEIVVRTLAQRGAALDLPAQSLEPAMEMTQEIRRKYAH
ncbi:MAG: hydroxymethylglutaryl-CoA lyase [Candidatus Methylomirabilis sp.]